MKSRWWGGGKAIVNNYLDTWKLNKSKAKIRRKKRNTIIHTVY
jgi:hypothetical protein